jgi:hypothetical protein
MSWDWSTGLCRDITIMACELPPGHSIVFVVFGPGRQAKISHSPCPPGELPKLLRELAQCLEGTQ